MQQLYLLQQILFTDTAIKSVKKGGIIVIATVGENPEFSAFEEKNN